MGTDEESAREEFSWSPAAWHWLAHNTAPQQRRTDLLAAAATLERHGRITARLTPLLELGELDRADELVITELRRFLLFTPTPAEALLLSLSETEVQPYPGLALLTAELGLRHGGDQQPSRLPARHVPRPSSPTSYEVLAARLTCWCSQEDGFQIHPLGQRSAIASGTSASARSSRLI